MRRITKTVFGALLLIAAATAPARAAIVCINGTLFSVTPGLGSFNLGTSCGNTVDLDFLRLVLLNPIRFSILPISHFSTFDPNNSFFTFKEGEIGLSYLERMQVGPDPNNPYTGQYGGYAKALQAQQLELLQIQNTLLNTGVDSPFDEADKAKMTDRMTQLSNELAVKGRILEIQLREQQRLSTELERLSAANNGGVNNSEIAALNAQLKDMEPLQQEVTKLFGEVQNLSAVLQATQ